MDNTEANDSEDGESMDEIDRWRAERGHRSKSGLKGDA